MSRHSQRYQSNLLPVRGLGEGSRLEVTGPSESAKLSRQEFQTLPELVSCLLQLNTDANWRHNVALKFNIIKLLNY